MPTRPLKFYKRIAALPATLEPDAVYAVRVGAGFDFYISDITGAIAHKVNGISGDYVESLEAGLGITIDDSGGIGSIPTISIGQEVDPTSLVTFGGLTLDTGGSITFADGSIQRSKAPQMYTNADAELGLTIDDLLPGDYYYDDITESIFIMVDTGLGYNQLLDLTVRA
jgi:hypothetical protein